jgi:hypothetical protein
MSRTTKPKTAIKKIPTWSTSPYILNPPTLYIIFQDGIPKTVAKEWGAKIGYRLHDCEPYDGHKSYITMIEEEKDYDVMFTITMNPEGPRVMTSLTPNDGPVQFISIARLVDTKLEQVKQTIFHHHFVHQE